MSYLTDLDPLKFVKKLNKWAIDFWSKPLSSGEIPNFIKEQNESDTTDIPNNFPTIETVIVKEINTVYLPSKTLYITNTTNVNSAPSATDLPVMPPRLLLKEIPVQQPTDPPNKPILSLQKSFATKSFGTLLSAPYSDHNELIKITNTEDYTKKYEEEGKLAAENNEKWHKYVLNTESEDKKDKDYVPNWSHCCALVASNFGNNIIGLIPGIKPLELMRYYYSESSKMVTTFKVTGIIPKEYKYEIINPKVPSLVLANFDMQCVGNAVLRGDNGGHAFPFIMPKLILNILSQDPTLDNKELVKINNWAEFAKWAIINLDALIGEFPVKVEIDDLDPLNPNPDEKVKLKLPTIADTLAELYGLCTIAAQNGNTNLALIANLIPEILGTKTVSIVNQDFLKAIASYLGFKMGNRKIEYKTNFNPDKPKNWSELITPNRTVYTQGVTNQSQDSVSEYLHNLMFVAALQKEAIMTRNKDLENNEYIQKLKNVKPTDPNIDPNTSSNDPTMNDHDKAWINFLQHINKENTSFNVVDGKKSPFKPKVDKHKKI